MNSAGKMFCSCPLMAVVPERLLARIAEMRPPNRPGRACRFVTPAVSCRNPLSESAGVSLLKPTVEMTPPKRPIRIAVPISAVRLLFAPIMTPPAKEAFKMSSMRSFPLL